MKAYTDIEQSKILAKILPIESADMWWNYYTVTIDNTTPQIIHIDEPWIGSFNWANKPDNIPAWSLSALLGLMPKHIRIYKFHIFNDDGIVIKRWGCSYCAEDFHNRAEYLSDPHLTYPTNVYSDMYEDPVDAAFEMVVWLKENGKI